MDEKPERAMLTTQDAADFLGVTQSRIRQLRIAGAFPRAEMWGRDWLIPRADLLAFQRKPLGRPKKKRPLAREATSGVALTVA